MIKPILITGNRLGGLREIAQAIAWHYSPRETGIIRMEWLYENHENWECDPRTFSPITIDTTVLIIENIPDYFDYFRLWPFLEIEHFVLPDGQLKEAPHYIFTSRYAPRVDVSATFKKHYRLSDNYDNPPQDNHFLWSSLAPFSFNNKTNNVSHLSNDHRPTRSHSLSKRA